MGHKDFHQLEIQPVLVYLFFLQSILEKTYSQRQDVFDCKEFILHFLFQFGLFDHFLLVVLDFFNLLENCLVKISYKTLHSSGQNLNYNSVLEDKEQVYNSSTFEPKSVVEGDRWPSRLYQNLNTDKLRLYERLKTGVVSVGTVRRLISSNVTLIKS